MQQAWCITPFATLVPALCANIHNTWLAQKELLRYVALDTDSIFGVLKTSIGKSVKMVAWRWDWQGAVHCRSRFPSLESFCTSEGEGMQQHRQRCFCSKQDLLNIRIALCISCFQRLFKTWANLEVLTRTSRFDIHQTSQVAQAIAHFKRSPKRNVVAHLDKPSNNSETATSFVSCQTISLVPSRPVFTSRKKQALLIVHTLREVLARFGYRKKKRCFLRLERVRLGKITYI